MKRFLGIGAFLSGLYIFLVYLLFSLFRVFDEDLDFDI